MSKKTPEPQQPEPQPEASGSRWEPNAPTEQLSTAPPTPSAPSAAQPPTAYPTPVNEAPSSSSFASLKALSNGAKGALVGATAVIVLGSGVIGFAIGQAGDDHQQIDVQFGRNGFDRDGGQGGFPGGMPGPGQLPQGGTGQFQGQMPQGQMQAPQEGSGTTQNDSTPS